MRREEVFRHRLLSPPRRSERLLVSNMSVPTSAVFFLVSVLFVASICLAEELKRADLAGSWYPGSAEKLTSMLDGYFNEAKLENAPQDIIAIIAPHAGYLYSGLVAAYAYKAVAGMDVETVIIIGFSHRRYYDAVSVYDRGSFDTPLGPLRVDEEFAKRLILSHDKFYFNPEAFKEENSVETQLPFIRYLFKDKDIKIVPIAIGVQSYDNATLLGDRLYELLREKKRFLIIASTDMSHFHTYGEANAIDSIAVEALKKMDPKAYFDIESLGKCESCGTAGIVATMIAAKKLGADSIEILKYANSGDTVGMKDSVVGYLAAAIYKNQKSKIKNQNAEEEPMLNEKQKKRLLQIARETMEMYVKTGKALNPKEDDPVLNRDMGAFVTIHKHGQLRGCIGNIIGRGPLYLTVRDMAIESSTGDPRFMSVTTAELKDIDIEISVLSELKKVTNPDDIVMGKHGVLVKRGFASGVYLPQVATETGWSREEFLDSLCGQKAGMPADSWKKGLCEIYIFTADVFGE